MSNSTQEPKDSSNLWFKLMEVATVVLGFARLAFDVVRFIIER